MGGGVFFPSSFPSGKVISACRERGGMTAAGTIAVRHFEYHERLASANQEWVETGGTRQSGPGTERVRLCQNRHHRGHDRGGVRE